MIECARSALDHPQMLTAAILSEIARRVAGRPSLAVTEWQWRPLHGGVSLTTGGVYRVWGTGRDRDGECAWSVILKRVRASAGSTEPTRHDYWRRELLIFQSSIDFLPSPADGLTAPRCYGAGEDGDGFWLWLEDIVETRARPWPLARYGLAARHLGAFNGRFLVGRPLPREPWLATDLLRSYTTGAALDLVRVAQQPDDPLVRRGWPPTHLARMRALWDEREVLLTLLARLPQTVCHGDATDLNLLARTQPGRTEETVAIDWAYAGIGALGEDLMGLLRVFNREGTPGFYRALDEVLFAGYLEGLGDAGWEGDPRLARLGFTTGVALRYGMSVGPVLAALTDEGRRQQVERAAGMPFERLLEVGVEFREYSLGLADEARALRHAVLMAAAPGGGA